MSNAKQLKEHFSIKSQVSAEEWVARVELAAVFRLIAHFGWDDLINTHASVRVPGAKNQFLINPLGLMFYEITASSLVKVDLEKNILLPQDAQIIEEGFTIHSAIYSGRPDIVSAIHLHTRDGMAVSAQKDGLLPLSQHAMICIPRLNYHDYEGLALDHDERSRLIRDLADKKLLILRNHGTLACGESISEAFTQMRRLEKACEVQIAAMASGKLNIPPNDIQEKVKSQTLPGSKGSHKNDLGWQALLRLIRKQSPGFEQ